MKKFPVLFNWAHYISIVSLVLLPLFFFSNSYHPFTVAKSCLIVAVGLVIIGFLLTLWIQNNFWKPKLSWPFILFTIYLLWNTIASLFGESFAVSWWGSFRLGNGLITQLGILLFSFGIFWIAQKKDITKHIAGALALGSTGLAVYVYADFLNKNSQFLTKQLMGGTMGNSSFAAAYIVAGIAATILLFFTVSKKWKWLWATVGIFLGTNPLFLNIFQKHNGLLSYVGEARASTMALIVSGIIGLLFYLSFANKKIVRIVANSAVVVVFGIAVITTALLYSPGTSVHRAFEQAASEGRFVYQNIALQGISVHPVFGYGFNHFPVAFQQFFEPGISGGEGYFREFWVSEPHNMFLQTGVVGGIPGTALYLVFLGSIFLCVSYAVRKGALGKIEGSVLFGFFAAYSIQNVFLFDVPAAQMARMALLAIVASYTVANYTKQTSKQPFIANTNVRRGVVVAIWAGVTVAAYYGAIAPLVESIAIGKMQQTSYVNVQNVFSLSGQGRLYDESAIIHNRSEQLLSAINSLTPAQKTAAIKELQSFKKITTDTVTHGPDFMRTHIGLVYADLALFKASGYSDLDLAHEAQQESLRIIELSPRNQIGYWMMAQSLVFSKNVSSAIRFAQMAIGLDPTVPDSYAILLYTLDYSGNRSLFNQELKKAQDLFPDYYFGY